MGPERGLCQLNADRLIMRKVPPARSEKGCPGADVQVFGESPARCEISPELVGEAIYPAREMQLRLSEFEIARRV